MHSTARREGDAYVLNGQKNWISYATVADHQLVFAKTDPAAKHKGISAFIVERELAGRHDAATPSTSSASGPARRASSSSRTSRCRPRTSSARRARASRSRCTGSTRAASRSRPARAASIRACLERSVEYARERETFGQPIGKYQFVQDMIAEMVLGYETSKLLVMQAAWLKNEGLRNTRETSLAKWHATESAFRAAHLAIQVHGAYGYSAEYGIERYFRNARAPIIYEGTTQIHKMMQAEHALGYRPLNGRDGDVSPIASWAPVLAARTS